MEFLINTQWEYDPAYDQATKARLYAPIESITRELFREIYPKLQAHLETQPRQKSASSVQAFPTAHVALNATVLGMFSIVVGRNTPHEILIFVGREAFIEAERGRIVQHWREIAARPGMRMLAVEGFQI